MLCLNRCQTYVFLSQSLLPFATPAGFLWTGQEKKHTTNTNRKHPQQIKDTSVCLCLSLSRSQHTHKKKSPQDRDDRTLGAADRSSAWAPSLGPRPTSSSHAAGCCRHGAARARAVNSDWSGGLPIEARNKGKRNIAKQQGKGKRRSTQAKARQCWKNNEA